MPQVKTKQLLGLCCFVLLTFFIGCSDSERNSQSPIDPDTGRHLANWLPAAHMEAAKAGLDSCLPCHGDDFKGGISGVSCTLCHLGGPTAVHPADWVPVYAMHGPYVKANTTSKCANQYCHGLSLTGVSSSGPSCTSCHLGGTTSGHPTDWVPVYSTHGPYVETHGTAACSNQYCHGAALTGVADSGPSCTSCHMGGATSIHPAEWMGDTCSNHGNYAYTNGTAGCANVYCHGANLEGVQDSGPSCTKCHSPIPNTNQCNYCHGRAPDAMPNGTVYPNIAGKHAEHMQIPGVNCATCHKRPCDQHNNGVVDVVFDPSGPAVAAGKPSPTFDSAAKSCSNIACHIVSSGTFSYYFPDGTGNSVLKTVNVYGNAGGNTLSWYSTGSSCTTCHNDPPVNGTDGSNIWHSGYHGGQGPTGANNQCQLCHPDASSPDNGIGDTITNSSLHGNGIYNVDPSFDSTCFGCH